MLDQHTQAGDALLLLLRKATTDYGLRQTPGIIVVGSLYQKLVFHRRNELGGPLAAEPPWVAWLLDCAPVILTPSGARCSILIAGDDFSWLVVFIVLDSLDSATVKRVFLERIVSKMGDPRPSQQIKVASLAANFRPSLPQQESLKS